MNRRPYLRLLRDPGVFVDGTLVQRLARKDAALLALLAFDGACARDRAAQLLWPEQSLERARASLRQRRFRLARAAQAPLIDGQDPLRLLEATHDLLDPDAALDRDAGALDGELLDGLAFDDCPGFDQWLLTARARWRVQRAQALARIASRLEDAGRLAAALARAERLAGDEPLSDHAHRRLMRLHYLRGDLGAALEVYRRFAERLAAELGELPDDETAALAAALRRGEDAPVRPAAPVPPLLRRPPRLVGRDAAWAALQQAFDTCRPLLVEGPPGIGKSRLLGDFVAGPAAGQALAVAARAGDDGRPYALLTRLLARLWFDPGAAHATAVQALAPWARRELAALLPELGDGPPQLDALRLRRAAAAALHAGAPALIVLDDVQQSDAATLELLPSLTGDGLPCWWLAARSGELPPAVAGWLAASEPPQTLRLGALTPADLGALLGDLDWKAAPAETADELHRYTGGVPLFVLETLRSSWERPRRPGAPPLAAAQIIRARLARLPEATLALARAAAVFDAPLTLESAAALLGGAPTDWSEAFGALESSAWLDERGTMHDLVREAVIEHTPLAHRRWLHFGAAQWHQQAPRAAPLQAARHWEAAGRELTAAPLFEAAAYDARRAARPPEEVALWDRAIACWQRSGRRAEVFAAWRASIEARLFVAGPAVLRPPTEALLADARGDGERLDALLAHGEVCLLLGEAGHVETLAGEALSLARRRNAPAAILRSGRFLASARAMAGRLDEALATLDELQPAAAAADARERLGVIAARSYVLHRADRLTACVAALDEAIALAGALEDWTEVCSCTSNLASVLCSLGRYEAARQAATRACALLDELGAQQGVHAGNVHLNLGYALTGSGRLGSALAAIARARSLFATSGGDGPWSTIAGNAAASALLLGGDADGALAALEPPRPGCPSFVVARHHLLAARATRLQGGDPGPALDAARAALEAAPDLLSQLNIDAETALALPPAERVKRFAELARAAEALEQQALVARLRWWRLAALTEAAPAEAAAEARRLLAADAALPSDLLSAERLRLAQRAFAAAGAADADIWRERAEAEARACADDLARHRGAR